jgi:large subunit ribosomal protein L10
MTKVVKQLIQEDYKKRFRTVESALLIDLRGVNANQTNTLRLDLARKQIHVTVVRNTLARNAFVGTPLEALGPALAGPSAVAWGAESVVDAARELVEWAKKTENLKLKAAVLDGQLFSGDEGVRRLSRYPTRLEALARAVSLTLSPGSNIAGAVLGPGRLVMGLVKTVRERLEKGESINKAG